MSISSARTSRSPAETRLIGLALGRVLRGGDIVRLDGPLGAGKTTLVRSIAEGLGLDTRPVSSPTFVMIHEYRQRPETPAGPDHPDLFHIDAYRLRGSEELESLGWDAVLRRIKDGSAAAVIEWAERLGPDAALSEFPPASVRIDHASHEERRDLLFELPSAWAERPGVAALLNAGPTRCPVTGALVDPDSPTYPFASERARLADLYHWFSGGYTISRELSEDDLDEAPGA